MINKIEFSARNLTSNAGLLLLLEYASNNGVFDLIDHDLIFENASANKIKMNHIKTMLCGNFIIIDKLERLKLLQSDPLVNEYAISIREPETVSRFLGNFSYKTIQMLREINFKLFKKLLRKSKLKSITIDIDSSAVNVEGHQDGAVKGYNPKKPRNRCYSIQFALCDDIKAHLTGYVRSGDTYTANGAAEKKTVQIPKFVKDIHKIVCILEETLLNLQQDHQNQQPLRLHCRSILFDVESRTY